jgi:hypothetical protein
VPRSSKRGCVGLYGASFNGLSATPCGRSSGFCCRDPRSLQLPWGYPSNWKPGRQDTASVYLKKEIRLGLRYFGKARARVDCRGPLLVRPSHRTTWRHTTLWGLAPIEIAKPRRDGLAMIEGDLEVLELDAQTAGETSLGPGAQ